jgi:large subunit ribosomal protein L9
LKVILCENVPNLGEMGAEVNVADGYARNYLIPRKLAVNAHSASAKQIEHEKRNISRREEKLRAQLAEVAKKLEDVTVEIKVRAGEEDKIFGSVTTAHIAEGLKELGHDVDRKNLQLDEPIKSLGIYAVPVRLVSGIEANVKVWVTSEQPEEPEKPEEKPAPEQPAEERETE